MSIEVKYAKYVAKDYKSDQYVRWCPGLETTQFLTVFIRLWPNYPFLRIKQL